MISSGEYLKPFDEFQKAAAISPKMPFAHFALGYLYWEQRRFAPAAGEFRLEIEIPFGEADQAKGYLGDIALREGDRSAERMLLSVTVSAPDVRIAQYDLGNIYSKRGQLKKAARCFSVAIKLDPKRADAYYRLARICQRRGQFARARKLFGRVTALHASKHVSILRAMGQP